ncbi:ABC transporter permease [Rhodococcus erythropolis]|jgi:peptide/nickel transport system permease protein|uniref:ABC transporter permease n=1 Tax=Rhodococcus erythropolis TaxID=1833 RepID=A0A5N5E270_RHOER|nr:ABC transporter permease [Rhodococcus qingshengii]KAB2584206.1 ABC transporter permease [Rhodococcus erythropolis]
MLNFLGRKLFFALVLFLAVTALTFMMVFSNGAASVRQSLGETATDEQVAARVAQLGLDRSVVLQYLEWLKGLLSGDLGASFATGESVSSMLTTRIPVTISLVVLAILLTAVLSVVVGVCAAVFGGWVDKGLQFLSIGGLALPNFLVAIALVFAFAIAIPLFPATGYVPIEENAGEWAASLVLPVTAILVGLVAGSAQQFRGALIDTLSQDYIRTLRSRGVSERAIVLRHALRNAASPGLTVLSLQTIGLVGGAVLIERIFVLPGVGQLTQTAAITGDLPAVMGCVVFSVLVVIVVNVCADLLNGWINPKVRIS